MLPGAGELCQLLPRPVVTLHDVDDDDDEDDGRDRAAQDEGEHEELGLVLRKHAVLCLLWIEDFNVILTSTF